MDNKTRRAPHGSRLDWINTWDPPHSTAAARRHPRVELLLEPELSIVCFRYAASVAVNTEILLRLRRTTRSTPSSAVGGHLAIPALLY
jgi:hypothetical protein